MKTNTVIYETGAISHAVNDLILFTDNALNEWNIVLLSYNG